MYSLDFEEFLWAKGYKNEQIDELFRHLSTLTPFSSIEMNVMNGLFLEYAVVGGMPAIVSHFIETGTYVGIVEMQQQLLFDYEEDITKYAQGLDKAKIKNVYHHIPFFLAKENKKFQIIQKLGKMIYYQQKKNLYVLMINMDGIYQKMYYRMM